MSKSGVSAALKDLDRVAKKQRTSYPRTAELLDDLVSAAPGPPAPARPAARGEGGGGGPVPTVLGSRRRTGTPSGPQFRPASTASGRSASAHRRALRWAPAARPRRVA